MRGRDNATIGYQRTVLLSLIAACFGFYLAKYALAPARPTDAAFMLVPARVLDLAVLALMWTGLFFAARGADGRSEGSRDSGSEDAGSRLRLRQLRRREYGSRWLLVAVVLYVAVLLADLLLRVDSGSSVAIAATAALVIVMWLFATNFGRIRP